MAGQDYYPPPQSSLSKTKGRIKRVISSSIINLLWLITRNKGALSKTLFILATKYIDAFNDFSYDFSKNGEKNLLSSLSRLDFRIIFDVGANIGKWSQDAASFFPNAKIHTFELSPQTFLHLSERLSNLDTVNNNFGLGDFDGEIEYKDYGDSSEFNTILLNKTFHDHYISHSIHKSRIKKGESYCHEMNIKQIDLLKLDVEGAEHLVLRGFESLLQSNSIRCIQFEYGYGNGDVKFLMRDFFYFFGKYGYVVGRICSRGVIFTDFNYALNNFKAGPNFFAVREDDKEIIQSLSCRAVVLPFIACCTSQPRRPI